jgi:mRNA interferase HigB
MRIIAVRTLKQFWQQNGHVEQSLLSWYERAEVANWANPNELQLQFRNASIINEKRVVFNIHGNAYRLVADIEYGLKILFIV